MHRSYKGIAMLLLAASAAAACAPQPTMKPTAGRANVFAASTEPDVRPVYRITARQATDVDALAAKGMDIFTVAHGQVEGRPSEAALTYARSKGLQVNAIRFSTSEGQGLPSGFQTVDAIVSRMNQIAKDHPHLATVVDLGPSWQTVQGQAARKVWGIRLTANTSKGAKPKALFTAGQHARELAPPEITLRLIEDLVKGYGKDARITKILDTREAWIVPVVNPDGRVDVEKGNTMWRKNRHTFDFTRAIGVDLNRNFDSHWSDGDNSPNSEAYHGQASFSEPEIHGVRDLYQREKFTVSMDYHAYGGAVIWPPGWNRGNTPDQPAFARIGQALTKANNYDADTIARRFYIAPGSICDWAYEKHGVMAFGTEMGTSFRPSAAELPKLYAENKEGALHLLEIAEDPKGTGVPAVAARR